MSLPLPVASQPVFDRVAEWMCAIPHAATIGIRFMQGERGRVTLLLPYQEKLVGNRQRGVLHGGVITSLVDSSSALSIFSLLEAPEAIATLDLRIDYLRPATPGMPVYCTAECYRLTREIAFTRATAYQDDDSQPVAYSVGTFMRGSSSAAIGKGDAARQQEVAK